MNTRTMLMTGLAAASLFLNLSATHAETIYYEDFSSPTIINGFPYYGRTGDDGYERGHWLASTNDSSWGSTIVDGVASANTFKDSMNRGVSVILDFAALTNNEPGTYELSFYVLETAGSVAVTEIENLGEVFLNTADMWVQGESETLSGMYRVLGEENPATIKNLLNAGGSGWVPVANIVEGKRAKVLFYYDGDGDIGLAFRAYRNTLLFDNVEIRKQTVEGTQFTDAADANGIEGWFTDFVDLFDENWDPVETTGDRSEWITPTENGFTLRTYPAEGSGRLYHSEVIRYDLDDLNVGDRLTFTGMASLETLSEPALTEAFIYARLYDAAGEPIAGGMSGDMTVAWNGVASIASATAFEFSGEVTAESAYVQFEVYYAYFREVAIGSANITVENLAGFITSIPEPFDPEFGDKFTTAEDASGLGSWEGIPEAYNSNWEPVSVVDSGQEWVSPTRGGFVLANDAGRAPRAIWHTYKRVWPVDGSIMKSGDLVTFTGDVIASQSGPMNGMFLTAVFIDNDGYEMEDTLGSVDLAQRALGTEYVFEMRGLVPDGAVALSLQIYYFDNNVSNDVGDISITLEHLEGFVNASEVATWRGFPIDAAGWVDTGDIFGRLNVLGTPWIWSQDLAAWVYLPDADDFEAFGFWIYILR
jgi:hypothetical protein